MKFEYIFYYLTLFKWIKKNIRSEGMFSQFFLSFFLLSLLLLNYYYYYYYYYF